MANRSSFTTNIQRAGRFEYVEAQELADYANVNIADGEIADAQIMISLPAKLPHKNHPG